MIDIKNHPLCIALLPHLTIYEGADRELRRVFHAVCGQNTRSHRCKTVQTLSKIPLLVGILHIARAHIINNCVSKDVVPDLLLRNPVSLFSNDHAKLRLIIETVHDIAVTGNLPIRVNRSVYPLGEIDRFLPHSVKCFLLKSGGFFRMLHVVKPKTDNILFRRLDRSQNPHLRAHSRPYDAVRFQSGHVLQQILFRLAESLYDFHHTRIFHAECPKRIYPHLILAHNPDIFSSVNFICQ